MASEVITAIVDLLKQAPKVFFAGGLAGLFLLMAPNSIIGIFGLRDFRNQYLSWIGIATVLCISLLIAHFGSFLYPVVVSWIRWRRIMNDLTFEEKKVLRPYIVNDEPTQYFPYSDGVANGLQAKGILFRSSQLAANDISFAYNIQPWARRYLKRRKKFFDNTPNG